MFKILRSFFIIIFIFANSLNADIKSFKVSYDPDYAPFSYLEENKPQGLLIDYWKLWGEKNNYSIDFINAKLWDNAINLAKEGKVDFFLGTDPYEDWMKASNLFYKTQTSLFVLKDNSISFSKDSSYIIGIVGQDYEETIKNDFPNSKVIIYEDYKTVLEDFISKKIDLLYEDKIAIEYYTLQNKLFHQIRSIPLLELRTNISAISASNELIKIFNEGFKNLTPKELFDIEDKWIINKNNYFYKNEEEFIITQNEIDFINKNLVNVSVSKDWPPFTFLSNDNNMSGISSEIWQLIQSKINLRTKNNFQNSFTNQLNSIKNKTNDLIFSTAKTKEREKYSIFTKPYTSFPISIVTLKDENFIENMKYLFDKRIAIGNNFTAHKLLKEKYPNLKFMLVDSIKEGLEKVSNYEAYAYIDIKPNLTYNISKFEFNNLKISGNTGLIFELSIMIRDDYKTLQSILNKAIATLDKNEINNIVQKWENIQFEKNLNYTKVWIVLIIVLIIFFLLIYVNQSNVKKNKRLNSLVNERTKELKELNTHLEEAINIKTKELKRTNFLLDEAQRIAHLGSFKYNINKDELTWSEEYYRILGFEQKEIVPSFKNFLSCVHKDDRKNIKKQIKKVFSTKINKNKELTFEYRIVTKNSNIRHIQSTIKITKFDTESKPLIITGTILDITKVKYLELEKREKDIILAQKSKMAAMGEMLENIAHQWRQPLSVISTASTGLKFQLEFSNNISEDVLKQSLSSINEQSQYLSKTIDDFRNFFQPNKIKENFNIKNTINKSLDLINSRIKKSRINIVKDIDEIEIKSLENELIQVFLNIMNNAIDKLSEKDYEKYIFITAKTIDNKLEIYIKDNGGGISDKIINRIFEPYFTTKHKSQGTGIGLYMSNEIITKHANGVLKVNNVSYNFEDNDFYGALFIIHIPIS